MSDTEGGAELGGLCVQIWTVSNSDPKQRSSAGKYGESPWGSSAAEVCGEWERVVPDRPP